MGAIDDVVGERLRARLRDTAAALTELHRAIVDVARDEYQRARGERIGAGAFLQALIGEPALQWFRPIGQMVVGIDVLVSGREAFAVADARRIADDVDAMLSASNAVPGESGPRYEDTLQKHPRIAVAHGSVRTAIDALRTDLA
jgi:hypothetical protein